MKPCGYCTNQKRSRIRESKQTRMRVEEKYPASDIINPPRKIKKRSFLVNKTDRSSSNYRHPNKEENKCQDEKHTQPQKQSGQDVQSSSVTRSQRRQRLFRLNSGITEGMSKHIAVPGQTGKRNKQASVVQVHGESYKTTSCPMEQREHKQTRVAGMTDGMIDVLGGVVLFGTWICLYIMLTAL